MNFVMGIADCIRDSNRVHILGRRMRCWFLALSHMMVFLVGVLLNPLERPEELWKQALAMAGSD